MLKYESFQATGLFYCIWDVDEPARRVWFWRHIALILTWITCFAAGGLGSEIVQSLLPVGITLPYAVYRLLTLILAL